MSQNILDVTDLVKDDKIKVKSDETRVSEKLLSGFRKQIRRLEDELESTQAELDSYQMLDQMVKEIVNGKVQVDLANPDHTRAVAWMKKYVSCFLVDNLG